MAISDYLNELIQLKNDLVANLNTKNVTATEDEKFNTLVPKVLEITSASTVTEYELTGECYYSGSSGGRTTKCRVDISSISNYEGLILWENLFVFLESALVGDVAVSNIQNTVTAEQSGSYVTFTSAYNIWYAKSGGGWKASSNYVFKVYVIS